MEKLQQNFEILTEEEILELLSTAARAKEARIKQEEYWNQVNKKVEYPVFNYGTFKTYFLNSYIEQFKTGFQIDQYTKDILDQLLYYFTDDARFKGDLNKGLYLFGNPGTGKSSMMRVLSKNSKQPFAFKSCIDISRMYSNEGYPAIEKYMKMLNVDTLRNLGFNEIGWCFDDLGFEEKGKHYGKETEVMTEILEKIYNNKFMIGKIHVTSNISGDEVEVRYGNRIRSRMREMFNLIQFNPNSPDRRR